MPARRTSSYRPRKKRSGQVNSARSTAIIVVAALALAGLIYWISKPATSSRPVTPEQNLAEKPAGENQPASEKPVRTEPEVTLPDEVKTENNVEKAIYNAAAKLHIRAADVKKKTKDEPATFTVPIDPALSDLLFANMIFKGEVEKLGGTFNSGVEKSHRQILTFTDNPSGKKYNLELYYKKNELPPEAKGKVLAIIVDDFGNSNGKLLNGFAKTDPAVCFAIMPDTRYADDALAAAKNSGHETLIHAPMEPINYPQENPGDKAIFIQFKPAEITRRMERFIDKLPGCIGVNNHMGSLATADETTMEAVMQTLRKHNLLFVDSRTTNSTIAYKVAQKNQVPALKRDIFLDEPDVSEANLEKKLNECLAMSQSKSYVLAIMHCHTAAHLAFLNKFIARAEQSGFNLVPVSKLVTYKLPAIQ